MFPPCERVVSCCACWRRSGRACRRPPNEENISGRKTIMFMRRIASACLCLCLLLSPLLIAPAARADEAFNVRFSWKLKGEYAPFFLARDRGLFTKAGFTVHLGEGAGADAALGAVLQGQEDVVVIPGIYALSAISKGM